MKTDGFVFLSFTVSLSLTPIRYHYDKEQKRLWSVDEASGWWDEKWPGGVTMEEAFSYLGDVRVSIMGHWDQGEATLSASAALRWQ